MRREYSNLLAFPSTGIRTIAHRPAEQLQLFSDEAEALPILVPLETDESYSAPEEDLWVVKSGDLHQVLVCGFGTFLGKKSERLVVRRHKKAEYEFPLFRIGEIVVASRGISLSSDLLADVCRRGIRIAFLYGNGMPYAMVSSPMLTALIEQRREQLRAYEDRRGVRFAARVVFGKIRNQEKLLRYFGKYLKRSDEAGFEQLKRLAGRLKKLAGRARPATRHLSVEDARPELMGLEGVAGRLYWQGVRMLLEARTGFRGRHRRGASDPVNAALNYGYGILYSQVWGAVLNAALEPFAGFLHADRPGKPSLVLDLVEEFRQPIVDRSVIAMCRSGSRLVMEGGLLDQPSRRAIVEKVFARLESRVTYRGKKYQVRSIVQMQARRLAGSLRGRGKYRTFSFKW